MRIYNGTIISCDQNNSIYQYLVEDRGKIIYVGNDLPTQYADYKNVMKLGERVLLPSFGDGHIHFTNWALIAIEYFDVRTARNFSEFSNIIHNFIEKKKGKFGKILTGFSASPHSVEEKRLITRKELDDIYSNKPMIIIAYDGHSMIVNSKMIDEFPAEVRASRGFNEESGQLFNEAYYLGLDYATSLMSTKSLLKSVMEGYDLLAKNGIGLIHSVESIGFPKDLDVTLAMLIGKAKSKKTGIQTRMFFQTMDVSKVLKRKLPRVGGCFATALDGCFSAFDAAMLEPYTNDSNNKGILFYSDEEVIEFTKKANREGLQIAFHTLGDAAIKQGIKAIEAALQDHPRKDHRHILIHACLIDAEDIKKCAELGISLTVQPGFLISPLEPVSFLEKTIGDRIHKSSPFRKILDAGIHLSGGSDAPVTHPNPITGIYGACNHPFDSKQSLTIQEALKMHTYEVAWMSFDEKERGSLEKGKLADMVILNKNPLEMSPKDLEQLKVEQLYLQGKPYQSGMSFGSLLWNAMRTRKEPI